MTTPLREWLATAKGGDYTSLQRETQTDVIHRPNHYARWKMEPIEFIFINDLPFWLGNVVKYCMRYDAKDGIQDLKKARRYLDIKIKELEGDPNYAK